MATNQEMSAQLLKRFRNVPNVTSADTDVWIEAALLAEGFKTASEVPQDRTYMILILAQAEGAMDIAMSAAHFFSYADGDEQVDKSRVAAEWRQIEKELRDKYESERKRFEAAKSSVKFRTMKRLDRDQ